MPAKAKTSPWGPGTGYFAESRFADAVAAFRRAGDLSAKECLEYAEAALNLGLYDEALAQLKTGKVKKNPRADFLEAKIRLLTGDAAGAVKLLAACRDKTPSDPEILVELGMAYEAAGEAEKAAGLFFLLKADHRDFFEILMADAETLFGLKLFKLAKDRLIRAQKMAWKDAAVYYRLGLCFMDLNMAAEAETVLREAIRWRPSPDYYRELATVYEKSNRIDKALTFSRAPLAAGANNPYLFAVIAKCELRKGNPDRALEALESKIGDFEEPPVRAEALTTLGRVYDKLGRYREAYKAFAEAKRATMETPAFKALDLDYPYRTTETYEAMLKKGLPAPAKIETGPGRPKTHVFFMGFPRSGTTLLETVLKSHRDIATIDEKPVLRTVVRQLEEGKGGYPGGLVSLDQERAAYLRDVYFLQARNFTAFDKTTTLVDKMPLSTLHLPLITTLFPGAKILFSLRHPFAAALSCLMQNFTLNNAMGNLTGLDAITRYYDLVMGFWKAANAAFEIPHHAVKYEDVVADLEGETRKVAEFMGLPWDKAMLDYAKTAKSAGMISTPSYSQVVRPIYKESLESWKNYREYFNAFEARLTPWCEYFGYAVD